MRGIRADIMRIRRSVLGTGKRVTKAGRQLEAIERQIRRWVDRWEFKQPPRQKRRTEEGLDPVRRDRCPQGVEGLAVSGYCHDEGGGSNR